MKPHTLKSFQNTGVERITSLNSEKDILNFYKNLPKDLINSFIKRQNFEPCNEYLITHHKLNELMLKKCGGLKTKIKTQVPLITGMSDFHLCGSNLHYCHNSGVPIIRGSAIKGMVRGFLFEVFQLHKENEILIDDWTQRCLNWLGSCPWDKSLSQRTGQLQFFDVYPTRLPNKAIQKATIIKKGSRSSVPINYLAIKPRIEFQLCLGFDNQRIKDSHLLDGFLQAMFERFFVGAKKSGGFGNMAIDNTGMLVFDRADQSKQQITRC